MGLGAIPLRDMLDYWRHVGAIGPLDEFLAVIRRMDGAWLRWQRDHPPSKS